MLLAFILKITTKFSGYPEYYFRGIRILRDGTSFWVVLRATTTKLHDDLVNQQDSLAD